MPSEAVAYVCGGELRVELEVETDARESSALSEENEQLPSATEVINQVGNVNLIELL